MGLGPTHTVSLAEARDKARDCRKARLAGLGPIEARRAERSKAKLDAAKAMTFKACAETCIKAHQAGWRNPKHAAQWPATLGAYVHPIFGALPVQAIDTALVMKAIEPIWTEKPETAGRVRGRVESILDWAAARGFRAGENPARWRGHLENLLPKKAKVRRVEHHAALVYGEIGAFMTELRQQEGIAPRALEFAILTAARTGEVIGARWGEFDLAERIWTVPGERMKSGREHRALLSERALAILEEMATLRQSEIDRRITAARQADEEARRTAKEAERRAALTEEQRRKEDRSAAARKQQEEERERRERELCEQQQREEQARADAITLILSEVASLNCFRALVTACGWWAAARWIGARRCSRCCRPGCRR